MKKQIKKFLKTKSDVDDIKWYANERHIYETVLQEFMEFRKANKNLASGDKGWIKWDGGVMPVEYGTPIKVKYRCGDVEECKAGVPTKGAVDWSHTNNPRDIIAYKVR